MIEYNLVKENSGYVNKDQIPESYSGTFVMLNADVTRCLQLG